MPGGGRWIYREPNAVHAPARPGAVLRQREAHVLLEPPVGAPEGGKLTVVFGGLLLAGALLI
jgi:hypothetical protein